MFSLVFSGCILGWGHLGRTSDSSLGPSWLHLVIFLPVINSSNIMTKSWAPRSSQRLGKHFTAYSTVEYVFMFKLPNQVDGMNSSLSYSVITHQETSTKSRIGSMEGFPSSLTRGETSQMMMVGMLRLWSVLSTSLETIHIFFVSVLLSLLPKLCLTPGWCSTYARPDAPVAFSACVGL